MEAIREIREIDSDKIEIEIPKEFRKRKVEIILLPVDEYVKKSGRFTGFLENSIKIDDFQMPSREERNAR